MNPEEGELRPQLLDRFGLAVDVVSPGDPAERAEIVRRRIAFEANPEAFAAAWRGEEEAERVRIAAGRRRLTGARVPEAMLDLIARTCAAFGVDGLRGDLVAYKCARARAAYRDRAEVDAGDVRAAVELALLHRRRRQPFDEPEGGRERLEAVLRELTPPGDRADGPEPSEGVDGAPDQVFGVGPLAPVRPFPPDPSAPRAAAPPGRRGAGAPSADPGRRVGARQPRAEVRTLGNLALDATLRTAAPHQLERRRRQPSPLRLIVTPSDLRESVRETRTGSLVLFAVDASGSMAARRRMVAVKGAVTSLLLDAYRKRDRVGLVAFRGERARLLLPPTGSVDLAARALRTLPTGGRTPLADALRLCDGLLTRHALRDPERAPWLVLVSDGRPNVALEDDALADACRVAAAIRRRGVRALVLDSEEGRVRLGLNRRIATALGAEYLRLEDVSASTIALAVRARVGPP